MEPQAFKPSALPMVCIVWKRAAGPVPCKMHPIVAKLAAGRIWPLDNSSWCNRRAWAFHVHPAACCQWLKSFLLHVLWALVQAMVGLDDIIVGGQVQLVVLGRPMVNHILPAAMDAAECTLAKSKQNFVPASPLEAHTCLWAAPSAKQIPPKKWRRMLGPHGLFNSRPPRGSAMGLQNMASRTFPGSWATNVERSRLMVSQTSSWDKASWPSSWNVLQIAQSLRSARPNTFLGTSSSQYNISDHGLSTEDGLDWCFLWTKSWKLPPMWNRLVI